MLRLGQLVGLHPRVGTCANTIRYVSSSGPTQTAVAQPNVADKPKTKATFVANRSFVANIFCGAIEPKEVFPYPYFLTEEQRENIAAFVDPVTSFFTTVNNAERNDDDAQIDDATADALWGLGGMSFQVPPKYGGLGVNNTQYVRMGEITGAHDLGLGVCLGAHQGIGFKGILLYGTPEQKAKYLPQVSTGKVYAAFCLTEPGVGSDAASIKCHAKPSADRKTWILNGSKIWISNGGIANIMTVFAKTEVDDLKTGGKKDATIAFIVERGFGGVTSGPLEKKMGIRGSNTTEIFFEDTPVPVENVLGKIGDGFKIAVNVLNNGRFGIAATLSGTMQTCIKKSAEHVTSRLQFGNKLEEYGFIQEKLARMAMYQYVTQSMAYMLAGNMDAGSTDYQLEAAISKVFSSEAAWYVCDESIQIHGGMGFMKSTGLERVLRDLRIFRIFEGTNDILRLFIAPTGIQYAGGHLKDLQKAFKNPAANLGLVLKEVSGRAARKVGFGGSDIAAHVDPSLADAAKLCTESVDVFGATVEILLAKHGKNIIHEQFLLTRLADCAIDIYAMTVVLSRASHSISRQLQSAPHEVLMAQAWCIEAHDRVRVNNTKIHGAHFRQMFKKMKSISKNICAAQGVASTSPTTFNSRFYASNKMHILFLFLTRSSNNLFGLNIYKSLASLTINYYEAKQIHIHFSLKNKSIALLHFK